MTLARAERAALCDTFERLGEASPTLCAGWTTREMATHLVVREARPDAAAGMFLKSLAGHLEKVSADIATRPWPQLIDRVRQGPPRWSVLGLGPIDEIANVGEFFVHHEDVLRGADPTARRDLAPALDNALWGALGRMGRVLLRKSPVGVDVRCAGHAERPLTRAGQGDGRVVLTGTASEVLLRVFGRGIDDSRQVDVQIEGSPDAIEQFARFSPGL